MVYLYNPFGAAILAGPVLERLAALEPEREVAIAYHTPVERATIEARDDFDARRRGAVRRGLGAPQAAVKPPSITNSAPVTNRDSSLAR